MSEMPASIEIPDLDKMNERAIQNQFFTPDHVYIDLALLKDIPLGLMYADTLIHKGPEAFKTLQENVLSILPQYQTRRYDTISAFSAALGYTDQHLSKILQQMDHDTIFAVSPATMFFSLLIRHTVRNQNHSRPANKYVKRKISQDTHEVSAVPVTFYINTHPLTLSATLLEKLGAEFGESFGVNVKFINKDPKEFDAEDWKEWFEKIECFYLDSLGRFNRSDFTFELQSSLVFAGAYIFARKRFEPEVMAAMQREDFASQVQLVTGRQSFMCEFSWLPNNDIRLSEDEITEDTL